METKVNRQRLAEILNEDRVKRYITGLYDTNYLAVALSRWRRGPQYPPVDVLIEMARLTELNVSYILGLTDVKAPIDNSERKERTLEDLRIAAGMNEKELIQALKKDSPLIERYRKKLPTRISSIIFLAESLDLSLDYILGCTSWETWEAYAKTRNELREITAGSAVFVVSDKEVSSLEEVEQAILQKMGRFCIVSDDGETLVFPNGNTMNKDDVLFDGAFFANIEVKIR